MYFLAEIDSFNELYRKVDYVWEDVGDGKRASGACDAAVKVQRLLTLPDKLYVCLIYACIMFIYYIHFI